MPEASIEGAPIAYQETGSGSPLLLIHGTAAALWAELPASLAGLGHRVIAYDRRSFGGSAQPPLGDLDRHVRDAAALLEALGAAPATVVGWSMGGVIALALAIARPELVSALVLLEPPLYAKRHPSPRMLAGIARAKVLERRGRRREGAEAFLRWVTRERSGGSTFERAPAEIRELLLSDSDAILAELDGGTGEEISRHDVAKIACPVICLMGTNSDQAFAGSVRRLARALPSAELRIVEGAGHVMPLDAPGAVVDAVAAVHGAS